MESNGVQLFHAGGNEAGESDQLWEVAVLGSCSLPSVPHRQTIARPRNSGELMSYLQKRISCGGDPRAKWRTDWNCAGTMANVPPGTV